MNIVPVGRYRPIWSSIDLSVLLVIVGLFISLLFATGCDTEIPAIHEAVLIEDVAEVARLLESGVNVNSTDYLGRTPLYLAALIGSIDIVESLVSKGADIEKGANWKNLRTPLHVAASTGQTSIVRLLVESGANIVSRDRDFHCPLHLAAWHSHPETVELLLLYGADVNVKDKHNLTPLHIQELGGERPGAEYVKTIALLLDAGADVNSEADIFGGYSPLMCACEIGVKDAIILLILHGANVNARSTDIGSALDVAKSYGHKDVVVLLRSHGGVTGR